MMDAQTGLRIGGTVVPTRTLIGEAHTTTTMTRDYTQGTNVDLIDHVPTAEEAAMLASA